MAAAADFVASATLVAVTVTLAGLGAAAGAEYIAEDVVVEIEPQDGPEQPEPVRAQVTAVVGWAGDSGGE